MVSRFGVRPTSKRWFLKNSPSDHETWCIGCHVGIHVEFTSILHSRTLLVPQAKCEEADLDRLRRFLHQWECLKCTGHGLSVSCVKWPSDTYIYFGGCVVMSHMHLQTDTRNVSFCVLVEWDRWPMCSNCIKSLCGRVLGLNRWHWLGDLYDRLGRQRTLVGHSD